MGRHGKNLIKSVPFAKPMPDLSQMPIMEEWRKSLITDNERNKIADSYYQQGVYTALAVFFKIILFHYEELRPLRHRLPLIELYFNQFIKGIDRPDDEQRFAEWYYEETTGFEFKRKEDETMANKEAKITVGEFVDAYIAKSGKNKQDIAKAINVAKSVLSCLRYGSVSKKVVDAVMKHIGAEFTPGEASVYREAYGVGNNDTARFEAMEQNLLERENIRVEVKQEALEAMEQEQKEEEKQPIPVPEELPKLVEEVTAVKPEPPSILEFLKMKVADGKEKIANNLKIIEKLEEEMARIKAQNEKINNAVFVLESSMEAIQEVDF